MRLLFYDRVDAEVFGTGVFQQHVWDKNHPLS